jgi:hypothetical protein
MGLKMKIIILTAISLMCASLAFAELYPEFEGYYTKDSDNMTEAQNVLSVNDLIGKKTAVGLLAGFSNYTDPTRSEFTRSYQLRYTNAALSRWSVTAQAGMLEYLKTSMSVYSGNAVYEHPGGFRLETTIDKSLLDTFAAFDNDISVTTLSSTADFLLTNKITLIAGADSRSFSDGNERLGLIAKGILMLPIEGLSLQVWHRQFRDTKLDPGGYFNPVTINFQRYLLSYRKGLIKHIRLSIKAGPGTQQVNDDQRTNTVYLEAGLEKNIRAGLSFSASYIYTDSYIDNSLLSYKINILSCKFTYIF